MSKQKRRLQLFQLFAALRSVYLALKHARDEIILFEFFKY